MIQLYVKWSDVVPTEQEYMPHFEPHLQAQTKLLMERWRREIPVNGIYDCLKVNPDGTLSDGNARYIIAGECLEEMIEPQGQFIHELMKWAILPVDLNWFMGMQVFRGPQVISMRKELFPEFGAYLGHDRKLSMPTAKPYDFSLETKVPTLGALQALKIL